MLAVYAAIEAVADGKAGEVEIEHHIDDADGREETMIVTVRRDPQPVLLSLPGD